jgi:2-polyprenyl-6-methoxyphenol hydroxylase-like FAD-dependent oxidoreductase
MNTCPIYSGGFFVLDSVDSVFDRLANAGPPTGGCAVFDTACVLGGSIAGLLAARVLSDFAERVVIVERDELGGPPCSRPGTPQAEQLHNLLPAGKLWMERWLKGFADTALDMGATVSGTITTLTAFDGHRQALGHRDNRILRATRPLIESSLRASVLGLPSVSVLPARATGLQYRDAAVSAVEYSNDRIIGMLETDFVVDAMGRSSRVPDWLNRAGFEPPRLEGLAIPLNYATAYFERRTAPADLDVLCSLAMFSPGHAVDEVSIAATSVIENDQWIVALIGYEPDRPGKTIDQFRATSAKLPAIFREAVSGEPTRDVATYHQAESRRRHFTNLRHFPARLVCVGDAVASFNPIYGQGMSSAALHASCLSSYLANGADFDTAATEFFQLQELVVDAAWTVSAGADAARLDALSGNELAHNVLHQRWAQQQVLRASLTDANIAEVFNGVSYMLRHPAALADPALVERAVSVNSSAQHVQSAGDL